MHDDIEKVLLSESQIVAGLERMASQVTETYRGKDFTVVAVLKGSCIFVSDLIRRLPIPLQLAFAWAKSYGDSTQPGKLELSLMPAHEEIRGRRILLVDDILDSGRTMAALREELLGRGALDVRTCVFLDKPARRAVPFQSDFRCFEVDDVFVVGYGLDYAGSYRNLPYVAALKKSALFEVDGGSRVRAPNSKARELGA